MPNRFKFIHKAVMMLTDLSYFARLSIVGATWMFALTGALISDPQLPWTEAVGLIIVATCFHFFAYVSNDLLDLDLDKTSSLRNNDPLVRGTINIRQALMFVLIQLPLSLLFCWIIKSPLTAILYLVTAFILILLYNKWGKTGRFPLVTDMIQGFSWACIFIFGALTGGRPNQVTLLLSVTFIIFYIIMINGIHGSLRDIQSDSAFGVRTTAIALGGKFISPDSAFLSRGLRRYATSLHLILILLPFLLIRFSTVTYSLFQRFALLSLLCVTSTVATALAYKAIRAATLKEMIAPGTVHAFLLLFGFVLSLLLFRLDWATFYFMLFIFYAPVLAGGWFVNAIKALYQVN
jgi:4-hydroxybenzoate polyprenyltransferase